VGVDRDLIVMGDPGMSNNLRAKLSKAGGIRE
jgi:hypothetical protein